MINSVSSHHGFLIWWLSSSSDSTYERFDSFILQEHHAVSLIEGARVSKRGATAEARKTAISLQHPPPLLTKCMCSSHPFPSAEAGDFSRRARTSTATLQRGQDTQRRSESLLVPQRTSTDRMCALLNVHPSSKNRKDIVSSLQSLPTFPTSSRVPA